jgi:RNA methyltransferase, TrmH family
MKDALFISSVDNPKVKELLGLREKRERDRSGLFLIEGYRELLRAQHAQVKFDKLFVCPELFLGSNEGELIDKIKRTGASLIHCSSKVFEKISYRDRPDGLVAIAKTMNTTLRELETTLKNKNNPLLVIAVGIEKPGNLGTILRSSDSAGADGVIVCDRCTDIYNPNVVRASVGTLFTLPVIETSTQDALAWLRKMHIQTIATTPSTEKIYSQIDLKKGSAIVVGTEQVGLSDEWLKNADLKVKIPMLGVADSLNVAMATTILLYEAVRQRQNG